jgi:hypothetical protein
MQILKLFWGTKKNLFAKNHFLASLDKCCKYFTIVIYTRSKKASIDVFMPLAVYTLHAIEIAVYANREQTCIATTSHALDHLAWVEHQLTAKS